MPVIELKGFIGDPFFCLAALRTGAACLGGALSFALSIKNRFSLHYVFDFLVFPPPTIISFSRAAFLTVKDITLKTSTFRRSKFVLYANRHKGRHFVIYIFRPFFLWLSLPVQIRQRTFYSGNCIGTHMGVYFRRF
jgi:hypothetical protein